MHVDAIRHKDDKLSESLLRIKLSNTQFIAAIISVRIINFKNKLMKKINYIQSAAKTPPTKI